MTTRRRPGPPPQGLATITIRLDPADWAELRRQAGAGRASAVVRRLIRAHLNQARAVAAAAPR